MPSFLKSIFKPSTKRQSHRSGALPPGVNFSPPRAHADLSTDELTALTQMLQERLTSPAGGHRDSVLQAIRDHPQGGEDTMRQLTAVLQGTDLSRDTLRKPYQPVRGSSQGYRGVDVSRQRSRRGRKQDLWAQAVEAASVALALAEKLCTSSMGKQKQANSLLQRICSLIEAQREELLDIRPYAKGHGLPTLSTLKDIYTKLHAGLQDAKAMPTGDACATLSTLTQVLLEGPDYLIDVSIIEAIVWQAEVIDPNFGAEIKQILDKTVAGPPNEPTTFKRAAESIITVASALAPDHLDDIEAVNAYKAIGILVKQLQVRLGSSRPGSPTASQLFRPLPQPRSSSTRSVTPAATPLTFSATPSPVGSPTWSPARSPVMSADTTRSTTPDPDLYTIDNAADLQARYGTGPIGTPSKTISLAPTPSTPKAPPEPSEPDTEEPEVWEYRGNLLTRSALSLVLRQEALAKADSSGQYAGEVSWDDLRNAWIPKWAEKLKPEDVADGEIPSTNPAMYKMKKKDAWGNRIGWRDGVMYYKDEPSFDLSEDD